MAWTLHFVVWITVLNMCRSHNPPFPQFWVWGRNCNNWQVATSTAYKYPLQPHQLQFAVFPLDSDYHDYSRTVPDSYRSYPRTSEEVKVYQPKVEEPKTRRSENGSSKILNNFLRKRGQVNIDNQIVFPGPTAPVRRRYEPEIPDECKKSTLCENVLNYPQEAIDKLISEIPDLHRLQLDQLDLPETPDITQRLGPTEENIELCKSQETVMYPKSAKGTDDKWYTLINNDEKPVQGFKVEICEAAESPCLDIAVFVTGYVGRCKQKYVLRTAAVVVTNPDNTLTTVEKQVKVPSCCSCVAKANIT